ncbi:MAG: hypothetical protein ABW252_09710 [Polyangiales bacterium]
MSELSSDARALIEAGRFGDAPAGHDKARVRERLVRQIGVGAFAGTGMLAVVRSAGSSGGSSGALASSPRVHPASITDAPTLPRGVSPAGRVTSTKLAGAGAARVGSAVWVKSLAVAATAAGALYSGAVMLEVIPSKAPPPAPLPAQPAEPALEPTPTIEPLVVTQPKPEAEAEAEPEPLEARPPTARRARREAAPASDSLSEELALLARAQRMLRDDQPKRALGVVGEHAERFPEGALREERDGIEALARCLLGEHDAPSVKSFLERSPSSPLAARVRKECRR